jgi:hypothetical protein
LPLVESTHQCDEDHCVVCCCLAGANHTMEKMGPVPPSSGILPPVPPVLLLLGLVPICLVSPRTRTPVTDWNRMNN